MLQANPVPVACSIARGSRRSVIDVVFLKRPAGGLPLFSALGTRRGPESLAVGRAPSRVILSVIAPVARRSVLGCSEIDLPLESSK